MINKSVEVMNKFNYTSKIYCKSVFVQFIFLLLSYYVSEFVCFIYENKLNNDFLEKGV